MTDRKLILKLCKRLKLNRRIVALADDIASDAFCERDNVITIGAGDGYRGFYIEFIFDKHGKLIEHRIEK